jgi:glycine cleavage system H lipoate-binding protein
MVVLLIVLTFAVMVLVDHLFLRQPVVIADAATDAKKPARTPSLVAGFELQPNLKYHPGHTWAVAETPELVRIGADDFAMKIAGHATGIDIPERGQWIRQGQRIIAIHRDGPDLELVSPIEGTVVDINEAAIKDPEAARKDPYGNGWLLVVNAPDQKTNFRNLLSGTVVRRWLDDAAAKLRPAGLAQEGGVALDNGGEIIPAEQWQKMERELFTL